LHKIFSLKLCALEHHPQTEGAMHELSYTNVPFLSRYKSSEVAAKVILNARRSTKTVF